MGDSPLIGISVGKTGESPTSSQFVRKGQKGSNFLKANNKVAQSLQINRKSKVSKTGSNAQEETIEEALIDLYLSVKIRSNEEIDAYNEEILLEERERLTDTSPFTILEYIKTSIEILMNMKMEEHQDQMEKNKKQKKKAKDKDGASETESVISQDGPPSDYEQMLQKYEAEVRNHIKIEQ